MRIRIVILGIAVISLLSSCVKYYDIYRTSIPSVIESDTLYFESGYDDIFIYNNNIVLGERNTGRIFEYIHEGTNFIKISPYMQIFLLNEYLYYQSVYDWRVYYTDIYNIENTLIDIDIQGNIFIPQNSGNFLVLEPSLNQITMVNGDIHKEFTFEQQIADYDEIKISSTIIAVYKQNEVMLFDYFGNLTETITTGSLDDFCIFGKGILGIYKNDLLYADYQGSRVIMKNISGDKIAAQNGKVFVYDSLTGHGILIKLQ